MTDTKATLKEWNARESLAAQWREWLESFGDQSHSGIKASAALAEIERLNRALSDETRDAERYRKLKALLSAADFGYFDKHEDEAKRNDYALIFRLPAGSVVSANLDRTVDALPEAPK